MTEVGYRVSRNYRIAAEFQALDSMRVIRIGLGDASALNMPVRAATTVERSAARSSHDWNTVKRKYTY